MGKYVVKSRSYPLRSACIHLCIQPPAPHSMFTVRPCSAVACCHGVALYPRRPHWIFCPAPSVDYWVKATLGQGWYCFRKRGLHDSVSLKLWCKSPRVRAGPACPSTPSSVVAPCLVWTAWRWRGNQANRERVVEGDPQYRMPLCWCLDTSCFHRGMVRLHKTLQLDDLLPKLDHVYIAVPRGQTHLLLTVWGEFYFCFVFSPFK